MQPGAQLDSVHDQHEPPKNAPLQLGPLKGNDEPVPPSPTVVSVPLQATNTPTSRLPTTTTPQVVLPSFMRPRFCSETGLRSNVGTRNRRHSGSIPDPA
jgi:hypothetical protein